LKLSQLRRLADFEELLERFEALVSGKTPPPPSGSAPKPASKPRAATAPPTSSADEPSSVASVSETEFMGRLVEQLKASKPMLHALVSHHQAARLDGERLTLSYLPDQEILAEQLQQKALKQLLEEQASKLLGRKVSVKVELTREAVQADEVTQKTPDPAPVVDDGPETLRERADRDPLVRQFIDTFQGEIESVQKPDG
jgi:hypothetical protein